MEHVPRGPGDGVYGEGPAEGALRARREAALLEPRAAHGGRPAQAARRSRQVRHRPARAAEAAHHRHAAGAARAHHPSVCLCLFAPTRLIPPNSLTSIPY